MRKRKEVFYCSHIQHAAFHSEHPKTEVTAWMQNSGLCTAKNQGFWKKKYPKCQQAMGQFGEPQLYNTQSYNYGCNQLLAG